MDGVPESFNLSGEHSFGTTYKPGVHRLFEESYKTTDGEIMRCCAGWLYDYGKGKAFYFSPGEAEETRYDPNVLKILGNVAEWFLGKKKE